MSVLETDEQKELRAAVAKLAERHNYLDYVLPKCRAGEPLDELWNAAADLGFLGVNLPEEYGGGGAGIYELALVQEELAAQLQLLGVDINQPLISKIERNRRFVKDYELACLCQVLQVSERDLLADFYNATE